MLAGQIGARGRVLAHGQCTCTGDALDVVSLHWTTRAERMDPPAGVAPAGILYKRNPQAAAWRQCLHCGRHANASQSPVLPRARLAYDACLNAGSTAVLAHGHQKTGAPTRSCTELTRLPSERIAGNALGARKLASLTGFAPVISCLRGRRVWLDYTTGTEMVRAEGFAPST